MPTMVYILVAVKVDGNAANIDKAILMLPRTRHDRRSLRKRRKSEAVRIFCLRTATTHPLVSVILNDVVFLFPRTPLPFQTRGDISSQTLSIAHHSCPPVVRTAPIPCLRLRSSGSGGAARLCPNRSVVQYSPRSWTPYSCRSMVLAISFRVSDCDDSQRTTILRYTHICTVLSYYLIQ
ncbi:hypothetical protein F4604DRAFT_1111857 [Suillus subluteus]|nr:hypothetical protein F4604DRAFT_1111857 [Suillus subluteus]